MEDLADQLKAARKERGWSQNHVAGLIGVDQKSVRRWEKREGHPHSQNLEALRREMPELAPATVIEQLRIEVAELRQRVEQLERQRRQND
jgi:transcriptional regulator with XRE-family HTH domain